DYYELAPDFFAQVIRSRVSRWRRLHDLARDMSDSTPELAPVVRKRMQSINSIQSFVIERIDDALKEWSRRELCPIKTSPYRAAKAPAGRRSRVWTTLGASVAQSAVLDQPVSESPSSIARLTPVTEGDPHKYIIAFAVVLAALMQVIDSSIVNV